MENFLNELLILVSLYRETIKKMNENFHRSVDLFHLKCDGCNKHPNCKECIVTKLFHSLQQSEVSMIEAVDCLLKMKYLIEEENNYED